ncbi:hypothetical protein Sjap_018113 [Stephania japonica]|uniref:Uncharacterized protein n=1 Tax=Stephania japonica TaxID=461633 RepID=A0AAP0I7D6_9MAGN
MEFVGEEDPKNPHWCTFMGEKRLVKGVKFGQLFKHGSVNSVKTLKWCEKSFLLPLPFSI